jgi:6-phosphofructokinase
MIKRLDGGRSDGVVVLAEGLIEILDPQDLGGLDHVERDEHGHLRLADVDIGDVLRREVTKGMKALGLVTSIVAKNVGYELRCADPIPFDMEYTRDLGYCAAQFLFDGGTGSHGVDPKWAVHADSFQADGGSRQRPGKSADGRYHGTVVPDCASIHDSAVR